MGWTTEESWSVPGRGRRFLSSSKMSEEALGSNLHSTVWKLGAPFLGTERVGHETEPLTYV